MWTLVHVVVHRWRSIWELTYTSLFNAFQCFIDARCISLRYLNKQSKCPTPIVCVFIFAKVLLGFTGICWCPWNGGTTLMTCWVNHSGCTLCDNSAWKMASWIPARNLPNVLLITGLHNIDMEDLWGYHVYLWYILIWTASTNIMLLTMISKWQSLHICSFQDTQATGQISISAMYTPM